MVRPTKKQLEKLKKQDKELSKLPSVDEEKKRFKKGESFLEKLLRRKKVKPDVKNIRASMKEKQARKKKR